MPLSLAGKGREITACLAATIGAMAVGTTLAWSNAADDFVNCSNLNMTARENLPIEWMKDCDGWGFVSPIMNVGALLGALCGGFLMELLGRKWLMMGASVPAIVGWVLLLIASNPALAMAGRFCCGLSTGLYCLCVNVYIGECASAELRGALGASFQILITIGICYVIALGFPRNWIGLNVGCIILPVILDVALLFLPESPAHYLRKKNPEAAKKSLQWLRGPEADVDKELASIQSALDESMANRASMKDLLLPMNLKPFLASMGLMLLQQLSGINIVIFNMKVIFEAVKMDLSGFTQALVVTLVQVVVTAIISGFMNVFGRKTLLVVSDIVMGVSLVVLGVYFFLSKESREGLGWIPLISLVIYISMFSIGFGPIPWMMMGEVFPGGVREVASSIATAFNWTMAFAVTQSFTTITDAIGMGPCFFMYGGICLLGTAFVIFVVPETKGKTLEEIQRAFGVRE